MEKREITFTVEKGGLRLDKVIRDRVPDLSRTQAQRLIATNAATVGGDSHKPAYRVKLGDRVTVVLPEEKELEVLPEPIPLDVIYEDAHLLLVNKPSGMVVHPAPGHPDGTLVNALLAHCPQIAGVGPSDRAGIVHRLDKGTSGLLIVAKNKTVLDALQKQFKQREVAKTYLSLVEGRVQPPEGIVEVPVGRDEHHRQKMAALRSGKYARTRYRVVESFADHTLLEAYPHTGRTHQVRVHLAWLGYPVVGDTVYGRRHQPLLQNRHFLHALRLCFTHPDTGKEAEFEAPLPVELTAVIEYLSPSS